MSSPLDAHPQVSHSTDNSNLSPQVTKHSKQIDVHAPILNTTPTQTRKRLNNHLNIHKEKPLDGTQLTLIY